LAGLTFLPAVPTGDYIGTSTGGHTIDGDAKSEAFAAAQRRDNPDCDSCPVPRRCLGVIPAPAEAEADCEGTGEGPGTLKAKQ
jgi:hypothetical protein